MVGVGHAGRWVGCLGGLLKPVDCGVGVVGLSRGILTGVGISVPVSLFDVGCAGARWVDLPIGVLLEESNLGLQGGEVFGTGS